MTKDNVTDILNYWDQEKDGSSPNDKLKTTARLLLLNQVRLNLEIVHAGYDLIWFKYTHEGKEYKYQVGWDKILRTFECLIKGETKKSAELAVELTVKVVRYIKEFKEKHSKDHENNVINRK